MTELTAKQRGELRARTARLIAGPPRVTDLHRILLGVRTRTGDGELVQELADFVAHPDRRDTGFNTLRVRNMFQLIRFKIWHLNIALDAEKLAPNFLTVLQAAFDMTSQATLRRDTGLNRSRVKGVYRDLRRKISHNPDGTYRVSGLNADEEALLKSLLGYIIALPPPNADRLLKEFARVLVRNGIIDQPDTAKLSSVKPLLALFMVASMHTCRIELGTNDFADLEASHEDGTICVVAHAAIPRPGTTRVVKMSVSIFDTGLPTAEWCESSLLQDASAWSLPLEVTDEPKLRSL